MFKCGCVVLLVTLASACSGSRSPTAPAATPSPTPAPIPAPVPPPISTFHLTGVATDDDGNPVAGANITIQPYQTTRVPSVSVVTDGAGFYSVDFDAMRYFPGGWVATSRAEKSAYELSTNYIYPATGTSQTALQNVHLYRIRRIAAGASLSLTVLPDDTFCGFNDEWRCRTVRIAAPTDGMMTVEVIPTESAAALTGLEMFVVVSMGSPPYRCCSRTASLPVVAGTEVVANVLLEWTARNSQSFTLNTSMTQQ
jgi:hypothetical protein